MLGQEGDEKNTQIILTENSKPYVTEEPERAFLLKEWVSRLEKWLRW